MFLFYILSSSGCRQSSRNDRENKSETNSDLLIGPEGSNSNVKFRSFQSPDSTWGFTIFVNSKPFLHYKTIPADKSVSGFESQQEADEVASLFVKKIRKGDMTPALTKNEIDSLGLLKVNKI
jgi:hypothetical protein